MPGDILKGSCAERVHYSCAWSHSGQWGTCSCIQDGATCKLAPIASLSAPLPSLPRQDDAVLNKLVYARPCVSAAEASKYGTVPGAW
jgi:hypothetical protein